MDITSLHYFRELTKDFNMTKTAARLYISPQTLSNHIQRLEQYYGTPLFSRKPALALTVAGEFVLSFAQEMEKENTKLRDILADIGQSERGVMRFGATVSRGKYLITHLLPKFYERYPKIQVQFFSHNTPKLEQMVHDGELDFAVTIDGAKTVELMRTQFMADQVYLCVPDNLLTQYYGEEEARTVKERSRDGAVIQDFAKLPFSILANRLGERMSDFFMREGCAPNVYFTGDYAYQPFAIATAGIAACYGTYMCMVENKDTLGPNLNIFPLTSQGNFVYQYVSFSWNKSRKPPAHVQYFLELLQQDAASMKHAELTRIVGD